MPQSLSDLMLKSRNKCECCPYGYHIDRDFVRYCETLYNDSYLDKLKQIKREKRRQHQSLEAYLGLTVPSPPSTKTNIQPLSEAPSFHPSPSDVISTSNGLRDAVLDFEETFQSSRRNSPKPTAFDYTHGILASQQMANTMATLTHAGADGSSSGIVGINKCVLTTIREQMATSLQRMRELEEQVKAIPVLQVRLSVLKEEKRLLLLQLRSKIQKTGNLISDSKVLLMDETGDEDIEEKLQWLMNETGEEDIEQQLKRLESEGIITPRLIRKHLDKNDILLASSNEDLPSPIFSSSLSAALVKKGFIEMEVLPQLKTDESVKVKVAKEETATNDLKHKRNVGTACSVLTRDVGVSHVPERTRSVGIGDNDVLNNVQALCSRCNKRTANRLLSGSSSPESIDSDSEFEKNNFTTRNQVISCTDCKEQKSKTFETKTTNTDTDALLQEAIKSVRVQKLENLTFDICGQASISPFPQRCKICDERAVKKFLSVAVGGNNKISDLLPQKRSCGTNTELLIKKDGVAATDLKMDNITLKQGLEVRKKSFRTHGTDCYLPKFSTGVQVSPPKLRMRDVSTVCDAVSLSSVGVQVGNGELAECKRKIDAGVGNYDVNNLQCSHCSNLHTKGIAVGEISVQSMVCEKCSKKKTRSTAVGDYSVSQLICERCKNIQTRTIGSGNFSIYDSFCSKCELHQAETVGTEVFCDRCSTKIPPEMHSVGINTVLDASSTSSLSSSLSGYGVRICDKCNATIQSVAQEFVHSTSTDLQSSTTSRIPRLNIPLSTSSENQHIDSPAKIKKVNPPSYIKKIEKSTRQTYQTESSHISFQNPHARYANVSSEEPGHHKETATVVDSKKKISSSVVVESSTDSSESSDSDSSKSPVESSHIKMISSETATLDALHVISRQKTEPSKEMKAACKVLNDNLQKPERQDGKKISSSLTLIQKEWFKIVNVKKSDPYIVEDYIDFFEEISQALLHYIVNMTDDNGNTAMHYAVSYGNFDVVSILLDSKVCDLNKQNKAGYTCMMLVSLAETKNDVHCHVVKRLFRLGDVNIKAKQNGQTALMLAASHKKLVIVKLLLQEGAEVNLQDNDGSTALMCAAEHGHMDIVQHLLASPDCDPSLTDNDESNALSIAMEAGHRDIGLLIYANMNFSRGSSPYSSLKGRKRACTPRSTPPARTPPLPSPSSTRRSTSSLPQSLQN